MEVSPRTLDVLDIDSYVGLAHTLFALEDLYGVHIGEITKEKYDAWRYNYRNIWVKPLKRDDIIRLRPYKSYLQTTALICTEQEHKDLSQRLLLTGLVKISDGFEMSNYAFGEAHDGVFTLRCYSKLVSVQNYS